MLNEKIRKNELKILLFILIFQALFISIRFGFEKKGYHVDEIWQAGIANGADGYGITLRATITSSYRNLNTWLTPKDFNDIITVQKDEIFNYKMIWENATADTKGPFGYIFQHFISSLTPDVFSKWQMFIINIIMFFIIQFFLYKTAKLFCKEDESYFPLLLCLFFGFCIGALNTVIFLRMYAIETAIATAFYYFSEKLIFSVKDDFSVKVKDLLPFLILNLIGGLTDYLYLVFAFFMSAFTFIYILFKKKFKVLIYYSISSFLGILLIPFIFPGARDHIVYSLTRKSSIWGTPLPINFSLRIFRSYLLYDLTGIDTSYYHTMAEKYILWGLILILILFLVCRIIFRSEWKKYFVGEKIKRRIGIFFEGYNKAIFPDVQTISSIIFLFISISLKINLKNMGEYTDRYFMIIIPISSLYLLRFLNRLLKTLTDKTFPVVITVLVLSVFSQTTYFGAYFIDWSERSEVKLSDVFNDSDVILLGKVGTEATYITPYALSSDHVYISPVEEYDTFKKSDILDNDKPVYLIIDTATLIEYLGHNRENIKNGNEAELRPNSEKEIIYYFLFTFENEPKKLGLTALWTSDGVVYQLRE